MGMQNIKVNGRYLSYEDGAPFFYLGDTAWELFHALSREEAEYYMSERARQGFNVVQAVALAERDGLTKPNFYGRLPLKSKDGIPNVDMPDLDGEYSYWDHVDYIFDLAERYSMYIAFLPTWGDKFNKLWGAGPEIFDKENAYRYGKWLGKRYGNRSNIIWMLGGDRPIEENHLEIITAMAEGIKSEDSVHLMTLHPRGASTSYDWLKDASFIDFHTSQTGHTSYESYTSYEFLRQMAAKSPKPYMDAEPRYEDNPANFIPALNYFWTADDIRINAYWSILEGACGHTYGNHNIWSMNKEPDGYFTYLWSDALLHIGAEQMKYIKQLRLSRDYYSLKPCYDILLEEYYGEAKILSAIGDGYAYIYSPLGLHFTVDMNKLGFKSPARALWFDTKTGEETLFTVAPNYSKVTFVPPSQGKGNDWLLILEDSSGIG